ncbi:hypothetical protein EDB87DRAFT_1336499 [Lactarius vividus]|nr:hypothetical protein EDB87DRAFT_1336499 [Lactarius vividus]
MMSQRIGAFKVAAAAIQTDRFVFFWLVKHRIERQDDIDSGVECYSRQYSTTRSHTYTRSCPMYTRALFCNASSSSSSTSHPANTTSSPGRPLTASTSSAPTSACTNLRLATEEPAPAPATQVPSRGTAAAERTAEWKGLRRCGERTEYQDTCGAATVQTQGLYRWQHGKQFSPLRRDIRRAGRTLAFDRSLRRDGEVFDMRSAEVYAQAREAEGWTVVEGLANYAVGTLGPADAKQKQRVLARCRAGTIGVRPGPHLERVVFLLAHHVCDPQAAIVGARRRVAWDEDLYGRQHASPFVPAQDDFFMPEEVSAKGTGGVDKRGDDNEVVRFANGEEGEAWQRDARWRHMPRRVSVAPCLVNILKAQNLELRHRL